MLPLTRIIETIEKGEITIDKDFRSATDHKIVRYKDFVVFIQKYANFRSSRFPSSLAYYYDEKTNSYGIFNYGNPNTVEFMEVRTDHLTEIANKLRKKLGMPEAELGRLHFRSVTHYIEVASYTCNKCGREMKTSPNDLSLLTCMCGNIRHDRDTELEKKYRCQDWRY